MAIFNSYVSLPEGTPCFPRFFVAVSPRVGSPLRGLRWCQEGHWLQAVALPRGGPFAGHRQGDLHDRPIGGDSMIQADDLFSSLSCG